MYCEVLLLPRFEKIKTDSFRLDAIPHVQLKSTLIKLQGNEAHNDSLGLSIQLVRKERFQRVQSLESVHLLVKELLQTTTTVKLVL